MTGCLYLSASSVKAVASPCFTHNIRAASGSAAGDIMANLTNTSTATRFRGANRPVRLAGKHPFHQRYLALLLLSSAHRCPCACPYAPLSELEHVGAHFPRPLVWAVLNLPFRQEPLVAPFNACCRRSPSNRTWS